MRILSLTSGAAVLAAVLFVSDARAGDEPAPAAAAAGQAPTAQQTTLWKKLRAGHDLVSSASTAAIFDGAWSLTANYVTQLTNRTWDAPYPWGTIAQYSTRFLYGLSWTAMLALESAALVIATGGNWDWLGEANYRSDWIVMGDAPACPSPGAYGGCGVGIGDFAFVQLRPRRSRWWFEAGGGWVQQRISNDQFRTVAESSWVLTPISAVYELKTDLDKPVALRAFAGPGVYAGMHNAHMHPTLRGRRERNLDAPWHGMYPLDGGIGPGIRAELRAIFFRHLSLEAELVVAPFLAGGPVDGRPSPDIAPLDFEREGTSVWRKASAGIAWVDPRKMPFKPTLAFFASELSERPVVKAGYQGVLLRFEIPLRSPGDPETEPQTSAK